MNRQPAHSPFNIPVINNLRGVAALMVSLFHFVCTTKGYVSDRNVFAFFNFFEHGVQVFFVISGIVIPLSMIKSQYEHKHFGKFILKRFIRLEPPYIAALLVALTYFLARRYVPSSSSVDMMLSTKEILLHFGYLIPFFEGSRWAVASLWTLSVEFQYYLFLALIFPFAVYNIKYGRFVLYAFFLLMPFMGTNGAFFPYHATLFLVGIVYAFWFTGTIEKREYLVITALAFIVCFIKMPFTQPIVGFLTLLVIHFAKDFHNRYLGFLGAISYSLYLTHQATGIPLINFMSHFMKEGYQKFFVIVAGSLVAIGCAYLLYRFIELPCMRWSKSVRYDSTPIQTTISQ